MKTKDKDLLINPLADVKPPREGPSFVETKLAALGSLWGAIKDGFLQGAFGRSSGGYSSHTSWPAPPPRPRKRRGGLSGLGEFAPGMPNVKSPKCPLCGTNDCLDRKEMKRLRNKSGSLGNTLLRSCAVRSQLKAMDKFRLRTSSGDEVWMTKQGRIQRPTKPPPPPNPPKPSPPINELLGGSTFTKAQNEKLNKLKAENVALKILMDHKLAEQITKADLVDDTITAHEALAEIRRRKRTRPPIR